MIRIVVCAALLCAAISRAHAESGIASYYGGRHHGSKMANGQRFDQWSDSCAHKSHRFGTRLRITIGGRSIECVVRDRGPFVRGRVIDLSVAGARQLGIAGRGVAPVKIEVMR